MTAIPDCQVGTWQRKFLSGLFRVLFAMRGWVNFTNLAHYSIYIKQTFRRHFQKAFNWVAFNLTILRLHRHRHPRDPLIGAFDCSYLPTGCLKIRKPSSNCVIPKYIGNVKRWHHSEQRAWWFALGLLEAKQRMNQIAGHEDLPKLRDVL
jgi:hypothetical protein